MTTRILELTSVQVDGLYFGHRVSPLLTTSKTQKLKPIQFGTESDQSRFAVLILHVCHMGTPQPPRKVCALLNLYENIRSKKKNSKNISPLIKPSFSSNSSCRFSNKIMINSLNFKNFKNPVPVRILKIL